MVKPCTWKYVHEVPASLPELLGALLVGHKDELVNIRVLSKVDQIAQCVIALDDVEAQRLLLFVGWHGVLQEFDVHLAGVAVLARRLLLVVVVVVLHERSLFIRQGAAV